MLYQVLEHLKGGRGPKINPTNVLLSYSFSIWLRGAKERRGFPSCLVFGWSTPLLPCWSLLWEMWCWSVPRPSGKASSKSTYEPVGVYECLSLAAWRSSWETWRWRSLIVASFTPKIWAKESSLLEPLYIATCYLCRGTKGFCPTKPLGGRKLSSSDFLRALSSLFAWQDPP